MSVGDPPAQLRVHGVGGPQGARMVGEVHEEDVVTVPPFVAPGPGCRAGPKTPSTPETRFVRSIHDDTTEAYEWGGLTTGSLAKALWVVYLPFTLLNAAGWAHNAVKEDGARGQVTARIHVALAHGLAVLGTVVYVLWLAYLTLELVAVSWRDHVLGRADEAAEVTGPGVALDAVQAWVPVLAPVLFVGLVALVLFAPVLQGRWEEVGGKTGGGWPLVPAIGQRSFFSKAGTYRRRQLWHVASAAAVALFALVQYALRWNRLGLVIVVVGGIQVLFLLVLAAVETFGRWRTPVSDTLDGYDGSAEGVWNRCRWVPMAAAGAALGSLLTHAFFAGAALLARRGLASFPESDAPESLRVGAELGSASILTWILAGMVASLIVVAVTRRPGRDPLVVHVARRSTALGGLLLLAVLIPTVVFGVRYLDQIGSVRERGQTWVGALVDWYDATSPDDSLAQTAGAALLLLLPPLILQILRRQHRTGPGRVVGNIWDVLTFWPRRFHPLAPPTSAERAVPELRARIERCWCDDSGVVVVAHSQGTVLAAAAIASARPRPTRNTAHLVSFGSPLGTLYAPVWPAYVPRLLVDLSRRVTPAPGWVNYWRPSDPIGAGVPCAGNVELEDPQDPTVDELDDAVRRRPLERPLRWGATAGHSSYLSSPQVRAAIEERCEVRSVADCASATPYSGSAGRALRWAHQGGAAEKPANTVTAFRHAVSARATGLELDVQRSKDHELVVIHDRTTRRTTNEALKVRKQTLDRLRELDAGYWWTTPPGDYKDEGGVDPCRVPDLGEVLAVAGEHPLTIEVKARSAVEPLVSCLAGGAGLGPVTLTAFSDLTVRRIRRALQATNVAGEVSVAPGLGYTVLFLLRSKLTRPKPRARKGRSPYGRLQVPVEKLGISFASRRLVDHAHAAGMELDVWTVDDAATIEWALTELEVDGIMTDTPTLLHAVATALAEA
jgi:glycerophosphoryl diester phosphodiesterase